MPFQKPLKGLMCHAKLGTSKKENYAICNECPYNGIDVCTRVLAKEALLFLHGKSATTDFVQIGEAIFAKHDIRQVVKKIASTYIDVYTYSEPFKTTIYCNTPDEQRFAFSNALKSLTRSNK